MTTCPVCSGPMPPRDRHHHARVTCSRSCNGRRSRARQVVRDGQVDPAAVYRLTHGQPVTSTKAERLEATRQLRARGRTYAQVAAALRVDPRSIARYVAEIHNGKEAA